MRRILRGAAALVAVATALALLGCGGGDGGGEAAPKGPPAGRHGEEPIRVYERIEQVRARLVAASDLYFLRNAKDALTHLGAGREGYEPLSAAVRVEDPPLDREIFAAFASAKGLIERRPAFDAVRDRLSPLSDQLLGGAASALLAADAGADRGLQAEALSRLLGRFLGQYTATGGADDRSAELELQYSYGLLSRSQAVARGLSEALGAQKDDVTDGIADIREASFPENLMDPTPEPVPEVADRVANVQRALEQRFRLSDG